MNIDRELINSLLFDPLPTTEKIRLLGSLQHTFAAGNGEVYSYSLKHFEQFDKLPALPTLKERFPAFQFEAPPEPISFYLAQAQKHSQLMNIQRVLAEVEKHVISGDADKAMSVLTMGARAVDKTDFASKDLHLVEQVEDFIRDYLEFKGKGIQPGYLTGFENMDNTINGVYPGDYWLFVGRPGCFKTQLLCFVAFYMAENYEGPFIFFSKEMTAIQVQRRIYAIAGRINYKKLRRYQLTEDELSAIAEGMKRLKGKIIIVGRSENHSYDVHYIRAKILEYGAKVAFIDGMYFLGASSDWSDQTRASQTVRDIALAADCGIVATTQLNRKGATSPTLENIAYSDAYAQDASVLISIEREYDQINEKALKKIKLKSIKVREDEADHTMQIRFGFKRTVFMAGDGPDIDSEDFTSEMFGSEKEDIFKQEEKTA